MREEGEGDGSPRSLASRRAALSRSNCARASLGVEGADSATLARPGSGTTVSESQLRPCGSPSTERESQARPSPHKEVNAATCGSIQTGLLGCWRAESRTRLSLRPSLRPSCSYLQAEAWGAH